MFNSLPASAEELRLQMLAECVSALKLNTFMDNYDAERYSFDGVDRSTIFHPYGSAQSILWFVENCQHIFKACSVLADDDSKRLFLTIIAFRIAGHHSVRIPVEFAEAGGGWEHYAGLEGRAAPSTLPISGMFGGLKHFDFEYEGKRYLIDCISLKSYLYRKQYFYNRNGIQIAPAEGDHVIDGGACLGDTAVVFGHAVGESGCVYCFDPLMEHLDVLKYNAQQNPGLNIRAMPYGLSDTDVDCEPLKTSTYNPGFNVNTSPVPLRAIDTLVITRDIPRIDYIKLDVEGSELAALRGAMGSIRQFKPKLGISLYHKPNDIFEIPLFISEHFKNYRMHLGHYTIHGEETVLYCVD